MINLQHNLQGQVLQDNIHMNSFSVQCYCARPETDIMYIETEPKKASGFCVSVRCEND